MYESNYTGDGFGQGAIMNMRHSGGYDKYVWPRVQGFTSPVLDNLRSGNAVDQESWYDFVQTRYHK